MICPQTKAECKNLAFCDMTGKCLEHEADLLTPTPPTLAEIERLVDELLGKATFTPYAHPYHYRAAKDEEAAARAALMAAIRAYGRE